MESSELRQDIISGDWVLVAPERAKRAKEFFGVTGRKATPIKRCPFENLHQIGSTLPYLQYGEGDHWRLAIIENKYPALSHKRVCPVAISDGPYRALEGAGRHTLLITRDHSKNFAHMSTREIHEVFTALSEHYQQLRRDECLQYVSIFHNWGLKAGASQSHPHCQIIALPVIPPGVHHALIGSREYFNRTHVCAHCHMIKWEKSQKERVLYENEGAIVIAPYVSKQSFELKLFPQKHLSHFEKTPDKEFAYIAKALQVSLRLLELKLSDPDYNFFIHTVPMRDIESHQHYHWHIEIVPKTAVPAGFELGTGIIINPVSPEHAVAILKGKA